MNYLLKFAERQIPHPKETHQKEAYLRAVVRMILVIMQEPSRPTSRGSPPFRSTDRGGQPNRGPQIPTLGGQSQWGRREL